MKPSRLVPLSVVAATIAFRLVARASRLDLRAAVDRRMFIKLGAGAGAAALAMARGWVSVSAAIPYGRTRAINCVLTPEQTEGPYYIASEKVRRDIRENKPGTLLDLKLVVRDATTCKPIKGAAVDVWHCDSGGIYSGFVAASTGGPGGGGPTDKRTFLRGIQRTNAQGVARFTTIYPGWYAGRTVHIHVKVHVGGTVIHTGQLYFPDSLTDAVYRRAPYNRRPNRTTRNASDGIFTSGGRQSMLRLSRRTHGGFNGSITMGVRRG